MLCILILFSTYFININSYIVVDTYSKVFMDEYSRQRIFHGINAVYKIAPWIPKSSGFDAENSLSAIDAKNLRECKEFSENDKKII